MKIFFLIIISILFSSCASVNKDRYGFFPAPKEQEDSINWEYNKYNLMDSPDGSKDPTAKVGIWGATY
jgi:hypothetical protein